ncbi:MAG: phosphopentomutase [Elusimicrobiota bacterium]
MTDRVIIIVMDSVGIGYMPDAYRYNDNGTNTLAHIFHGAAEGLSLPNLCSLGLGKTVDIGCDESDIKGAYGKMNEISPGKDTTSGHWELAGLQLDFEFPTYPDGFPEEIIKEFETRIGTRTLGNYARSGTVILDELGAEHMKTGFPIVYTSADSVFQIAAHQDVIGLEKQYEYCRIAREVLSGEKPVARVIARPFKGTAGAFERLGPARKDYSLEPSGETLLDILKEEGLFVSGIGKIGDIFAHRGLTEEIHTDSNMDGIDKTVECMDKYSGKPGLIFLNLVEFDSLYGHRRDVNGYARALEELDARIPRITGSMDEADVLILTADHGCDPAYRAHTDHTREYVPLIVYGRRVKKGIDLGIRKSFADCGQTAADILGVRKLHNGISFRKEVM